MRRTFFRVSSLACAFAALPLASAFAGPAEAASGPLGAAFPPISPLTLAVLLGAMISIGFFGVAFLLDQLKEGGAPDEIKMLLGGLGAGGLAVTAVLFILTWPGRGYPEPEPERLWSPELTQARLDASASLADYGVAAEEGLYRVPVSRAIQSIAADPSLLAPQEITLGTPWEEMPLAERGQLLYAGLAPNQTSSISGYAACKTCHSLDGTRVLGPSFQGRWGQPAATSAGTVTFDADYVIESTREPNAKVADTYPPVMPAMQLTDEQLQAIIAYLQTL